VVTGQVDAIGQIQEVESFGVPALGRIRESPGKCLCEQGRKDREGKEGAKAGKGPGKAQLAQERQGRPASNSKREMDGLADSRRIGGLADWNCSIGWMAVFWQGWATHKL
jgi:hypothetical protein